MLHCSPGGEAQLSVGFGSLTCYIYHVCMYCHPMTPAVSSGDQSMFGCSMSCFTVGFQDLADPMVFRVSVAWGLQHGPSGELPWGILAQDFGKSVCSLVLMILIWRTASGLLLGLNGDSTLNLGHQETLQLKCCPTHLAMELGACPSSVPSHGEHGRHEQVLRLLGHRPLLHCLPSRSLSVASWAVSYNQLAAEEQT